MTATADDRYIEIKLFECTQWVQLTEVTDHDTSQKAWLYSVAYVARIVSLLPCITQHPVFPTFTSQAAIGPAGGSGAEYSLTAIHLGDSKHILPLIQTKSSVAI